MRCRLAPILLPEDYVRGFDSQKFEEEWGFHRLSRGRLVHRGSWYTPMEMLAFKLPVGTLVLLAVSALYWVLRSRCLRLAECAALVPALSVLALLSTQTGLNWPVRYALPALPFLCLAMGRPVQAAWSHSVWRWCVVACLLWNGGVMLRTWPHFFSYGNELIGGFEGARREFVGSNLDWGQDLYRLVRWRAEHPEARPLVAVYYGAVDPGYLEINDGALPDRFLQQDEMDSPVSTAEPTKPFYLAISSNMLVGQPANVRFESGRVMRVILRSTRLPFENAVAMIGRTIYVFHIVPTAADIHTNRDININEIYSCLQDASLDENWKFTFP